MFFHDTLHRIVNGSYDIISILRFLNRNLNLTSSKIGVFSSVQTIQCLIIILLNPCTSNIGCIGKPNHSTSKTIIRIVSQVVFFQPNSSHKRIEFLIFHLRNDFNRTIVDSIRFLYCINFAIEFFFSVI